MEIDYRVAVSSLNVREKPDVNSRTTGPSLPRGTEITTTDWVNDVNGNKWAKHSKGWSSVNWYGQTYLQQIATRSKIDTETTPAPTNDDSDVYTDEEVQEVLRLIQNEYNAVTDVQFKLHSARSIMGLPHQFVLTADERVPGSAFGRMFTENILMDMPLVTIVPGGPRFLTGRSISSSQRNSFTRAMADIATRPGEELGNIIEDILGGANAKYYSFETQFAEYMKYVTTLNRTMAIYLGIKDNALRAGHKNYENFDWERRSIDPGSRLALDSLLGAHGSVNFYFDKSSSGMVEGSSNMTDKSMLENAINTGSNLAKEADFIFGVGAGTQLGFMNEQVAEEKINALTSNLGGSDNMIKRLWYNLRSGMTTTIAGANMLLPEIWRDSQFARSYTLDVHLASPYGTPEAFYLNVGVPLNFLLALALPRQFGANAFYSPFLIQAFSNGIFNCTLGMVDSVSITRFGSGDSISRKGLPLEVRVSVTFKDLYGALAVSNSDNYGMLMNNMALLDFIANISGLNLNEPDLERKLRTFITTKMDNILNIPGNLKNRIFDNIRDIVINTLKY